MLLALPGTLGWVVYPKQYMQLKGWPFLLVICLQQDLCVSQ